MPLGGKLVLKGGETLASEKKIKKKKKSKKSTDAGELAVAEVAEGAEGAEGTTGYNPAGVLRGLRKRLATAQLGRFEFETQRMNAPKARSTPWGSGYRAAPEILHGYDRKVTGNTAEERLDMRAATKADKFCK
eukprot:gene15502-21589_t